jgi:hypothetical protein
MSNSELVNYYVFKPLISGSLAAGLTYAYLGNAAVEFMGRDMSAAGVMFAATAVATAATHWINYTFVKPSNAGISYALAESINIAGGSLVAGLFLDAGNKGIIGEIGVEGLVGSAVVTEFASDWIMNRFVNPYVWKDSNIQGVY